MTFELKNFKTAESARVAIDRELPKGTSRDKVMTFLKKARIECFDNEAEVVACRAIEPSANMVHVVWALAFYFDPLRLLSRVVVDRDYTGP